MKSKRRQKTNHNKTLKKFEKIKSSLLDVTKDMELFKNLISDFSLFFQKMHMELHNMEDLFVGVRIDLE